MEASRNTIRAAYVAWVIVCVLWGTTFLGIRIALEGIPPALIGGFRFTAAGALLALALVARGERLPERGNWGGLLLLGFLMIVIGNGGVIWAEQVVPSGIAAVIVASAPFWTNGMEALLPGGERFTSRTVLGLCIGFGGILLLVWPDLTAGGSHGRRFLFSVLAIQLAAIGWSAGSIYSRRHALEDNAFAASALQMLFGGLLMLVIATLRGEWDDIALTPRAFWAEVYLVIFGSVVGYSAYVYALRYLPISTVSLYAYVNPVIAVLIGAWLAAEPFGWRVVAAAGLVLGGIAVVRAGRRKGKGREQRVAQPRPSTV